MPNIQLRRRRFAVIALVPALAWGAVCRADAIERPADSGAPPKSETFDVLEIRVLGNTVLKPVDIERTVYPFLGSGRTLQTVEQAREALAGAYRDAGYGTAFVDIPDQSVDGGIVRLQVTEGRVERARVSGARYFSQRQIRNSLASVREGEVLHLPTLQKELGALAAQSPDRRITPLLKAGSSPGTLAADFKVDDSLPVHASVEMNDRYTADTSRLRASGTVSYANMFRRFDTLSLQYYTAPVDPKQSTLWALTYLGRTTDPQTQWALYAVRSDSEVAAVGTLNVIGKGNIYGARLIHAFDGGGRWFPGLTLGVDYKDFKENIRLPDETPATTPISYLLWTAQLSTAARRDRWQGNGAFTLSFGQRGLGNTTEEFAFKRYLARPGFFYLRANAAATVDVGRGFQAEGRFAGQYSPRALLSNEQFSFGGADSVRGYLEAEALADMGWSGSVQLLTPPWKSFGMTLRGELFADAALGGIQDPLPSQVSRIDLSSWGAGFRLDGHGVTAALDWARPMVDGPRTPKGDDRLHFSVRVGF